MKIIRGGVFLEKGLLAPKEDPKHPLSDREGISMTLEILSQKQDIPQMPGQEAPDLLPDWTGSYILLPLSLATFGLGRIVGADPLGNHDSLVAGPDDGG